MNLHDVLLLGESLKLRPHLLAAREARHNCEIVE